MSNKASLTNAELEFTQKIQAHFPRGVLSPAILRKWNGCSGEVLTNHLIDCFEKGPGTLGYLGALVLVGHDDYFHANKWLTPTASDVTIRQLVPTDFWFFHKIEKPHVGGTSLYGYEILKEIEIPHLFKALGGEECATTLLSGIHELLQRQPNGETGLLANGGEPNVFFVRGLKEEVCAVAAVWVGAGWYLCWGDQVEKKHGSSVGPHKHHYPRVFSASPLPN